MSRRTTLKEIAALPFMRPGQVDFDCAYAVTIWDARQRLALDEMIVKEPHKRHDSPDGLMHYIQNEPAQENKAGTASTGAEESASDSDVGFKATDSESRRLPK